MKFIKHEFGTYVVFKNENTAVRMWWLFGFILRRQLRCFEGYYLNAYKLW